MAGTIRLSESWQSGRFKCYRKTVGGREFYFTQDRGQSERIALALMNAWGTLRSSGLTAWNEKAVADALELAGVSNKHTDAQPGRRLLYDAIDDYLADYEARVSVSRHHRERTSLGTYKRYQSNVTLKQIGWEQLNAAVQYFRGRPDISAGKPMAVATVQTTVKAIKALYDWLDIADNWEAPRRFDRIFRVKYTQLMTAAEVKASGNGQDVYTVSELKSLWKAATPRQRLYLGLALNTGELAQGIASLTKADVIKQGEALVVDRHRNKTGVRGVYPLWPEVADLVREQMDTNAAEVLAFKSGDGNPLVWFHATGRVDSISKTWANLSKRTTDVRTLGFASLRKTGASLIEHLTGSLQAAQLYLSHKGGSVAEKHYLAKNFQQLHAGLDLMYQELRPVFIASSKPDEPIATAA